MSCGPLACTSVTTPLGRVWLVGGEQGLAWVGLPDTLGGDGEASRPRAERLLLQERLHTELRDDPQALSEERRQVRAYLAGEVERFELVLDVDGPSFPLRVWRELARIPRGALRTYAEVARAVGRPGAARAVGGACRANPLPLVLPCHRVLSAAGLGGFAGGRGSTLDVKRALLELEGALLPLGPTLFDDGPPQGA